MSLIRRFLQRFAIPVRSDKNRPIHWPHETFFHQKDALKFFDNIRSKLVGHKIECLLGDGDLYNIQCKNQYQTYIDQIPNNPQLGIDGITSIEIECDNRLLIRTDAIQLELCFNICNQVINGEIEYGCKALEISACLNAQCGGKNLSFNNLKQYFPVGIIGAKISDLIINICDYDNGIIPSDQDKIIFIMDSGYSLVLSRYAADYTLITGGIPNYMEQ